MIKGSLGNLVGHDADQLLASYTDRTPLGGMGGPWTRHDEAQLHASYKRDPVTVSHGKVLSVNNWHGAHTIRAFGQR